MRHDEVNAIVKVALSVKGDIVYLHLPSDLDDGDLELVVTSIIDNQNTLKGRPLHLNLSECTWITDAGLAHVASLKSLFVLNLSGCSRITNTGLARLGGLKSLAVLDLSRCMGISDKGLAHLACLESLTALNLSKCMKLTDAGLAHLLTLEILSVLDLSTCTWLTDAGLAYVAGLRSLTELNLTGDRIGDAGASILATLVGLTRLLLSDNDIGESGARALASMSGLISLNLSGNKIGAEGARALLEAWTKSPNAHCLQELYFQGNGDLRSVLPAEMLERGDAQLMLTAYRRYRKTTLRPLNEAKLLVVGGEAVGKTSLIRYLVNGQPRNPNERKTPGAAIHERIETQAWSPASNITLNVWDFGGQEIMHGTRRFFLTARSLYLLVLENRREDDRSVFDWLKMIRNRGGESPVIVVINKCDDDICNLRLNESELKREYANIIAFVRTSCDPGERPAAAIAALRQLIICTLAGDMRLKHVRDSFPTAWLSVKEAVAERARVDSVLSIRDFERLCEHVDESMEEAAITDSEEQRALLQLLHDLGVVVAHGLDPAARAAARDITLLDPNWLTTAIYTLLTSQAITNQNGEFDRKQLSQLLDTKIYPPERHEFILEMMESSEVALCFELPDSEHQRYLIPEALPANEPDYRIWPKGSLRFRFEYSFLPRHLMPQFIVKSHANLTENPTSWQTGVVLGASGCRILVRGDRDRRRIDIMVDGPSTKKRSALNVVLNDLDAVHRRNPEIDPKPLVPLPHDPELHESYDHLQRLEQACGPDYVYFPRDSERQYSVRDLLDGVRRQPLAPDRTRRKPKRYSIAASDRAQVTIIGGVHSRKGGVRIGTRTRAVGAPSSWASAFMSWRFFSLASALATVTVAIIMIQLPSNQWRAIVGGLVALFMIVFILTSRLDPMLFYRRLVAKVIAGGMFLNAIGFSLDTVFQTRSTVAGFRWEGTISGWFYVAWAVIIVWLIWADIRQSQ